MSAVTVSLGDTFLMNGDATHALANYRKILDSFGEVSAADPNNGDARSAVGEANLNVGISLEKLGRLATPSAICRGRWQFLRGLLRLIRSRKA